MANKLFQFFDLDSGIYVFGREGSYTNVSPYFDANFWEDWERPIHVEFFEENKQLAFELDCGVKIFGNYSRANNKKSLSLHFRDQYGTSKLEYPIFPDYPGIEVYDDLLLRNSGGDADFLHFRDGFHHVLAKDLDFEKMKYRPAVLFINGKYWGIHNIREKSNEDYFKENYNIDKKDIDIITAYFGEEALSIAIICDQSMFLLLSSLGVVAAVRGSRTGDGKVHPIAIARRLLRFPPLIGCLLALMLSPFIDFTFAAPFFDKLAATVAPLALFSIGLQLSFKGWRRLLPQVSVALLYKLLIGPALVLSAALLSGIKGDIAKISVFEAAMPTVMTSSIICEQYGLNTRLVNLIIGISILTGLFSTALWYAVMR